MCVCVCSVGRRTQIATSQSRFILHSTRSIFIFFRLYGGEISGLFCANEKPGTLFHFLCCIIKSAPGTVLATNKIFGKNVNCEYCYIFNEIIELSNWPCIIISWAIFIPKKKYNNNKTTKMVECRLIPCNNHDLRENMITETSFCALFTSMPCSPCYWPCQFSQRATRYLCKATTFPSDTQFNTKSLQRFGSNDKNGNNKKNDSIVMNINRLTWLSIT